MNTQQMLSRRVLDMQESETLRMAALARELAAQGHRVVNLSLGEPDFDTPDHIKRAAVQALAEGYTKYTPVAGLLELRQAICRKFERDNGLYFQPNQIVVSNGAKQSIANLCMALLNHGDEAVVLAPYWVSYVEIIRLAEGVPVVVGAGVEDNYKVSPAKIAQAITPRTKFVIFSSPCNPSGAVFTEQELRAIADVLASHPHVLVLSDEIYEYIQFGSPHFSIGSVDVLRHRTVTINGFAKGYAMTGWRLGYIGAPSWIAEACVKIQGQFTSGATAFGQRAAIEALLGDPAPTQHMRAAFERRRDLVVELFSRIPGFRCNCPDGAFYLFPDVSYYFGKSDGQRTVNDATDFAMFLLERAQVSTVSGTAFGAPKCLRLSFAASDDDLRLAAARIAESVALLQ